MVAFIRLLSYTLIVRNEDRMKYPEITRNYILNNQALIDFGFHNNQLQVELFDDFYAIYQVSDQNFEVNIYEHFDDELFMPFNIISATGQVVASLREKIEALNQQIIDHCFQAFDFKQAYQDQLMFPFKDEEISVLVTSENKKWYALFMKIDYNKLNPQHFGKIEIVNVKVDPTQREALIDYDHIYPAYHMNKKHWITLVLEKDMNIQQAKQLLQDSYQLVIHKKGAAHD